jgi:hypothetical protein
LQLLDPVHAQFLPADYHDRGMVRKGVAASDVAEMRDVTTKRGAARESFGLFWSSPVQSAKRLVGHNEHLSAEGAKLGEELSDFISQGRVGTHQALAREGMVLYLQGEEIPL